MTELGLDGLSGALDPATVAYLRERLEGSAQVGLRALKERAAEDLRRAEADAACDYLRVEGESRELLVELERTDGALAGLERLLLTFKDSLGGVKAEMGALQRRSEEMHVELQNRKALSAEFAAFVDNILIEPQLIEDLLKGDVNDEFRANAQTLYRKLANLRRYNAAESRSVREVEPELARLKAKACERMKAHLLAALNALKRPNTNFQILQRGMEPDRVLVFFLKEHATEDYLELCQTYSRLLARLYANNLKVYLADLAKLLDERYLHRAVLLPDGPAAAAAPPATAEERAAALAGQAPIIVAHLEGKNNRRFPLEQVFAAVNELLLSSAFEEFCFCQRFFSLGEEEADVFFLLVLKPAFVLVLERLRAWAAVAQDVCALLLMGGVLRQAVEKVRQRRFAIVEHYLGQLEVAFEARVAELLAAAGREAAALSPPALRAVAAAPGVGEAGLVARLCVFVADCNVLARQARPAPWQAQFVTVAQQAVDALLRAEFEGKDGPAFVLRCLEPLAKALGQADALPQELAYFVGSAQVSVGTRLAERLLVEQFPRLVAALRAGADPPAQAQVEEIARDFQASWKLRLGSLKGETEAALGRKSEGAARVLKLVCARLLELYLAFHGYVQTGFPALLAQLPPTHRLSLDLHSILNV